MPENGGLRGTDGYYPNVFIKCKMLWINHPLRTTLHQFLMTTKTHLIAA